MFFSLALLDTQSNQEHVLLHGEDRLYLTCGDPTQIHSTSDAHPRAHLHPHDGSPLHQPAHPDSSLSQGLSTLLGHKHWHVVQVGRTPSEATLLYECSGILSANSRDALSFIIEGRGAHYVGRSQKIYG